MSSIPTLVEFNPHVIPYQYQVLSDIRSVFNYDLGVHEIMLSGSVGSAKSLLVAHTIVTHCAFNSRAVALIGRKAMPQLKDTLLQMILDHIGSDLTFKYNISRGIIELSNGSKIIAFSWADKQYKKVRSYALSCAAIEELTENTDMEFYKEIKMRVGRIPHIKEKFIICATNPDSPEHPAYKYFIEKSQELKTRHVYYSLTEQNPFLPQSYIDGLKETLSPKEADRMLRGKWVAIHTDVVFYNYDKPRNYKNEKYKFSPKYRFDLFFDFNIGYGKPMSAGCGQVDGLGVFHIAKDFVIDGARTEDICKEVLNSGLLSGFTRIDVFGDCNGKNNDTRNGVDDYSIIKRFFERNGFVVVLHIPNINPPLRESENLTNALCLNELNQVKLKVYKDAQVASDGLSFTKYKKGSTLIQDDSYRAQHISTAIRYWNWEVVHNINKIRKPVTVSKYM